MSLSPSAARDEIFARIWSGLQPTGRDVIWPDTPAQMPATATPWARVTLRHATGRQSTLADINGERQFERAGALFVQCFSPAGDGAGEAYSLAESALGAIEGRATPGGVWFRNCRLREDGIDGAWFGVTVIADFEYQETR